MPRRAGAAAVLEAVDHLEALARAGALPGDVAAEARGIAAGWWWQGRGEPCPGGFVAMVAELRRWCAVASAEHALRWERLSRAGREQAAERERRRAAALDEAREALGPLRECGA